MPDAIPKHIHTWLEDRLIVVRENLAEFTVIDPVRIPTGFKSPADQEIAGFLTAIISWGRRESILKNADRLMELMDRAPADFIRHHKPSDRLKMKGFVHRTFQWDDLVFFLERLQVLLLEYHSLEQVFVTFPGNWANRLHCFKQLFFGVEHPVRTRKHLSDPQQGSAAKRLNMFLRWMIRNDLADLGTWSRFSPSELMIPLDVHSGRNARLLGFLRRKQNDWKAVEEITAHLRRLDPEDPVKYDYVLYGTGAFDFLPRIA